MGEIKADLKTMIIDIMSSLYRKECCLSSKHHNLKMSWKSENGNRSNLSGPVQAEVYEIYAIKVKTI